MNTSNTELSLFFFVRKKKRLQLNFKQFYHTITQLKACPNNVT